MNPNCSEFDFPNKKKIEWENLIGKRKSYRSAFKLLDKLLKYDPS